MTSPNLCSACGKPGPHFVPPSLGEAGFFICQCKPAPPSPCPHCHTTRLHLRTVEDPKHPGHFDCHYAEGTVLTASPFLFNPLQLPDGIVLLTGDCLQILNGASYDPNYGARLIHTDYYDLCVTSPPYEDARTYDIDFTYTGDAWVNWAFDRYMACVRVTKGAVCWVIEGKTSNFQWSAAPLLLFARLHQAGVKLRKPLIYKRDGSFGSGGPDWFSNRYELIICSSKGRLPWSDNTAMGHPPKFPPGGAPTRRGKDGARVRSKPYNPPKLANPGNIIDCGAVGGGNIGNPLAHENEAPFPEQIPLFLIPSLCPPNGRVLDPFGGSGTTASVAARLGRSCTSIDIRPNQTALSLRRILSEFPP